MAKVRCSECGEVFDSNLQECPTCGCPASASTILQEQTEIVNNSYSDQNSTISDSQSEQQSPPPLKEKREMDNFEKACYILALLSFIMSFLVSTSNGWIANLDGEIKELEFVIATFGFLIVGRLTALINK